MEPIYLDNNSTTFIDPDVVQAISNCMASGLANPASQHRFGQKSRRRLEEIRNEILELLDASHSVMESDNLIFTSGGTESNNLALMGLAFELDGKIPNINRIIASSIEHPSVLAATSYLTAQGFTVERINCLENGVIDLDHLQTLLKEPTRLVSVMAVNHETGSIQPVEKIANLCRESNTLFHCDAVQAVGKIPVSFQKWNVDAMSLTAHKFHGPKGVGALVLRNGLSLFPRLFGGFQQQGFRPGTEDICMTTGLLVALRKFVEQADMRFQHVSRLRNRLEQSLSQIPQVSINGSASDRVPHAINVAFPGVNRQEFLMAADLQGLAVSTGSACASGSSDPSPVLTAMGLPSAVIDSSIRISLSAFSTESEIDLATERIIKISNNLRR